MLETSAGGAVPGVAIPVSSRRATVHKAAGGILYCGCEAAAQILLNSDLVEAGRAPWTAGPTRRIASFPWHSFSSFFI